MADLFLQRNMVREATAFLLDVLQDNDPKVRWGCAGGGCVMVGGWVANTATVL